MQYLPAVYAQDPFLGQFLLAFEKVLLGRGADGVPFPAVDVPFPPRGIEETIADLATYFKPKKTQDDPNETPDEFLPWLASWTAFSLRADLKPEKQREFIANVISLYQWRGTKQNLIDLLSIFTIGTPTIDETRAAGFEIGVHSTVGKDTFIAGGPPHYFRVTMALPRDTQAVQERQQAIARALIELEKPAHTYYDLDVVFPSMQIGVYSTVGVDTLLGSAVPG
jgi:phage tail-like protein